MRGTAGNKQEAESFTRATTDVDSEENISDKSKEIRKVIVWKADTDYPVAKEFRTKIDSESGYSIVSHGRFNPLSGKLSYSIIHQGIGRIYIFDLGADHRNPNGAQVGDKHKLRWKQDSRDKEAYVPEDIKDSWDHPKGVWSQFCGEAKLRYSGRFSPPVVQLELPL